MLPSTLHKFHHVSAGVLLELTWNPPHRTTRDRLRQAIRRTLIGGPDPDSPQFAVPQASFDFAMDLLNAGPGYLNEAEASFRRLGYSVARVGEVTPLAVRA